jgi:hypothetical protein
MCDEAASITDRILPNDPIRQWVLSLPFELRGLAAIKPDVLTAMGAFFAETGALSFRQRFGGSLNLHLHSHTLVHVHDAPPEKADLGELVGRVHDRALVWLRRRRYLDDRPADERSPAETSRTAHRRRPSRGTTHYTLARPRIMRPLLPRAASP